jgi:hypothetical protein
MKAIVIVLALLAAVKLGYQEYLYRLATSETIISAYRERAVQACLKDTKTSALGLTAQTWTSAGSVQLVVGRSGLDVQLWQVDHEMWNARYRNPYLVLTTALRGGNARCEYDIFNAAASVYRM